ncbi:VPS10 domain-containing protein [Sanyastnella coralliicola]|uniref:VPS10 domain-containing protein n=1 Tax=Sanyastnella coralliicola TaxID=3069118 RepID=UPI0027B99B9E|nr:PKD domain-containing protein [Longitalea sp. SCSIO 12813]
MRHFLAIMAVCLAFYGNAQLVPQTEYIASSTDPEWVQLMYSNAEPSAVRAAHDAYYTSHPLVKNQHTQYYKRWLRNIQATGNPQGAPAMDFRDQQAYMERYQSQNRENGEWEEMGPWHYDPEVAMYFQVQSPGACHIYTVEQAPANPDVVWAGSATAGIWKSVDKGMHWELMSRELLVTSVYSIAIDPNNTDIVYFGEGNGKIYKTTDGGATWALTGDANFQGQNNWVRDLKIKPDNANTLLAATNGGLFISEDAGANWNTASSGEHMEIEFHPTNPEMVYSASLVGNNTLFKKSTDGGNTWTSGTTGWPTPNSGEEQRRIEMAVTPLHPDDIYILASGAADGGNGLFGIYRSQDQGENFEFQCCGSGPGGAWAAGSNPNILGWSEDGTGDGGQFYYDLALDVSPDQEGRLFGAGINVWRSLDYGSNWSLNAHWVTWAGEFTAERYSHADVHDVKFFSTENGVDMWVASDGGLYYSADQGDNLEPRMYGIHGTDFWGWQSGIKEGDVMVGGTYHNGTHIRNGDLYYWGAEDETSGGWLAELAGDNFRGFVNPGDATIGYHDGGAFRYTEDRFERISGLPFDNSKAANTSYWWGEYGNMEWDPRCYNIMYSPNGSSLWKSTNGGSGWTELNNFGGDKIIHVKVAPRDPNRIYVTHRQSGSNWKIWRTSDGGENWEDVSMTSVENGNNSNKAIYIDVDGENPDQLWAILLGGQSGNKVFSSSDAGDTWQDIGDEVINNVYITAIAHQRGTDGGLYLGSDHSVYYKDNTMDSWELYANNLPARTPVVFLQTNYCEGKVRCAGSRSVHQNDFYTPSALQVGFTANKLEVNMALQCALDTIRFTDNSVLRCAGASYDWTFEGAVESGSEGYNAMAMWNTPGTYDVSLTVTDEEGNSASYTWEDMITVISEGVPMPVVEDFNGEIFPPENWKLETSGLGTWEPAVQLDDASNGVAQFPNYWVDTQGLADLLVMPAMDFTDVESPLIHFDVAHVKYADYEDGLELWYRVDAGEWTPAYSKFGDDLTVEDCYVWFWYDLGGELVWRTDSVDLSMLSGESCVELAFANIGGYGNHTWIDNVNLLDDNVSVSEIEKLQFTVFPNPSTGQFFLNTPVQLFGQSYEVRDLAERLVDQGVVQRSTAIDLSNQASGMYLIEIVGAGVQRVVKE